MRSPGPPRAFGQRLRKRRNNKIATVAVARKLACLTWQLLTKQQDYIYERPALTHRKLRQLELAAGAPRRSNPRGSKAPATPDTPASGQLNAKRRSTSRSATKPSSPIGNPSGHPRQSLDYIRRA